MSDFENARLRAIQAVHWGASKLAKQRKQSAFIRSNDLYPNYFVKLRTSENPPLSAIRALADWFDMGLEEFIEEAWAHRNDEEEEENALVSPKAVPDIAFDALTRFSRVSAARGDISMAEDLEVVDELRHSNPSLAITRIKEVLPLLAAEQMPFLLQIAASCFRTVGDFREAAHCLRQAEDIAKTVNNRLAQGDNLQRWVYLLGSLGYRRRAFEKNQRSFVCFAQVRSTRKLGEALVDQGYCLYYLGDFTSSLASYIDALGYGNSLNVRNRASALQGAAQALVRLGNIRRAKELVRGALKISSAHPKILGTSFWTLAKIEHEEGNAVGAEENFLAAVEAFRVSSPLEALLVFLECSLCSLESNFRSNLAFDRISEFAVHFVDLPRVQEEIENLYSQFQMCRLTADDIKAASIRLQKVRPCFSERAVFSEG